MRGGKQRQNGFTLVELLIVIVIIGILAGMMVLSVGRASDKAEVAKVVSNIRAIKTAAIMYKLEFPQGQLLTTGSHDGYYSEAKKVAKLLQMYAGGNGSEIPGFTIWGGYDHEKNIVEKQNGIWLIYDIGAGTSSAAKKSAMQSALKAMAAKGMPLMSGRTGTDSQLKAYSGGDKVFVFLDARPRK